MNDINRMTDEEYIKRMKSESKTAPKGNFILGLFVMWLITCVMLYFSTYFLGINLTLKQATGIFILLQTIRYNLMLWVRRRV